MSWDFELIPEKGQFSEQDLVEIRDRVEAIPHLTFAENLYGVFVDTTTRDEIAEGIRLGIHGGEHYIPRAAFVTLGSDRLLLEMTGNWADELLSDIVVWCQQRWPSVLVNSTGERVTADVFKKPRPAG